MSEKKVFERLPKSVVPVNYALTFTPDLAQFSFKGSEVIEIEVKEATSVVKVNCADIDILSVTYKPADGDSMVGAVQLNAEDELATFSFPSDLAVGSGTIAVEFNGKLNDRMKGFYRSKYTTPEGETRYAATTQFEPTDARLAFPCWDEPAVKATFDVTLVVPKDKVALSNMPVVKDEPDTEDSSRRVVTFDRTPIMSTYLLAFIVGEFDFIEKKDADGVLVRVYTPVGKSKQGEFALDVSVKTLPFYKEYFGIPYPLPKLDLIAIADFAAGAMENWGLVTYRENRLLVDPVESSTQTKMGVAMVVGHELAHMWFGNLVTMEWWTHLWLNEGFATFVEYLAVDHCLPEFNIWNVCVTNEFSRALQLDGMASSHPIEVPVKAPSEVEEIFDAISYSKGSVIIRMLHNWVGDEAFRKGLNAYLTKHQYDNAFTEDLWAALAKASGLPVPEVMTSWTSQMGYPVLSVSERQDGDNRVLTVSQEKFCADGKKPESAPLWLVPMKVSVVGKDDVVSYLLREKTGEIVVPNVAVGHAIKVNSGYYGFYRVQYDDEMLGRITDKLSSLAVLDRLNLVNDAFALAQAGLKSVAAALKLVQAYQMEDNYNVWAAILIQLAKLRVWVMDTDYYGKFKEYTVKLLEKAADKVGWESAEDEGPMKALLRALVLGRIGRLGHGPTVAEAQKRFDLHLSGEKSIPASMRNAVYSTVLKHGPTDSLDKLINLYENTTLQEEKVRVLTSLGAVESKEQLDKVAEYAISDKVRSGDVPMIVSAMPGSVLGRQLAWEFYKRNNKTLIEKYQGGFLLRRIVQQTTEDFADESMCAEVEAFMKANPAPATERAVNQSLDSIRINAAMKTRDNDAVKEFLTGQQ